MQGPILRPRILRLQIAPCIVNSVAPLTTNNYECTICVYNGVAPIVVKVKNTLRVSPEEGRCSESQGYLQRANSCSEMAQCYISGNTTWLLGSDCGAFQGCLFFSLFFRH